MLIKVYKNIIQYRCKLIENVSVFLSKLCNLLKITNLFNSFINKLITAILYPLLCYNSCYTKIIVANKRDILEIVIKVEKYVNMTTELHEGERVIV